MAHTDVVQPCLLLTTKIHNAHCITAHMAPHILHAKAPHLRQTSFKQRLRSREREWIGGVHVRSVRIWHVSHLTLDWICAPFGIPSRCHCIFDDSLYADHLVVHLARCDYLLDAHDDERRNAHLAGVVMIARTAGCSALQTRDVVRIPSPTSI